MADTKKVTRITASDDRPKKTAKSAASRASKATKSRAVAATDETNKKAHVFARIWAYFKGAWFELRQVRWPNRRATWALTIAVVLFSLFFVLLIVLLDIFFKWLFELIIT